MVSDSRIIVVFKFNFSYFINFFFQNRVTEDQLKAHLISVVGVKNLVSLVPKKNKSGKSSNWLVYVSNEDSLNVSNSSSWIISKSTFVKVFYTDMWFQKLENRTFTIGKVNFKIYKARENKKLVKSKLLVFLPRVPLS